MSTTTPQFDTLREKIAWEKQQRQARYAKFDEAFMRAQQAGIEAFNAAEPEAMVVQDRMTGRTYHVAEGLCGFAWVEVRPATSSFGRWLVKQGHGSTAYGGGIHIRVRSRSQSYERKMAYARAMAETLNRLLPEEEFGRLFIVADGRLD